MGDAKEKEKKQKKKNIIYINIFYRYMNRYITIYRYISSYI